MNDRKSFSKALAKMDLSHVDRAIAFLWFYKQTQMFDERTASELSQDLHEEGFPRPNVTLLNKALTKSKSTIRGNRKNTFQIDLRVIEELDKTYLPLINLPIRDVSDSVIPKSMVAQTKRLYLERIVHQINGAYDAGFYDSSAVLCRRLMESLIIEVYISNGAKTKIEADGAFVSLKNLIKTLKGDSSFNLGRNAATIMDLVKQVGDVAAHDRTYITQKQDIDDLRQRLRTLIAALINAAKL